MIASQSGNTHYIVIYATAVASGLVVSLAPGSLQLGLVSAIAVALLGRALRATVWTGHSRSLDDRPRHRVDTRIATVPTSARAFYYAGVASLGLVVFRPALHLTFSDMMFFGATSIGVLALLVSKARLPSLPKDLLAGVVLFGAGAVISSTNAPDVADSFAATMRVIYLTAVWFWLGVAVLTTPARVQVATALWVGSIAVSGFAAMGQLSGVLPIGDSAYGRFTGFGDHFNDLGGMAAIAFVPCLMFVTQPARSWGLRVASWVGLLGITGGIVLSGSIGALVAVAAGTICWAVISYRGLATLTAIAVLFLGAALFLDVTQTETVAPTERFASVTASSSPSASLYTREGAFDAAWREIADDPLIGVGLAPEGTPTATGFQVHNLALKAWYEGGVLALLGIMVVLFAVVRSAWAAVRNTHAFRSLAIALFCALISFIVFAMGAAVLFQRYAWIAAALIVALASVSRRLKDSTSARHQSPASTRGTSMRSHSVNHSSCTAAVDGCGQGSEERGESKYLMHGSLSGRPETGSVQQ